MIDKSVNAVLFSSFADMIYGENKKNCDLLREHTIEMFIEKFHTDTPTVGFIDSGYDKQKTGFKSVRRTFKALYGISDVKFLDLTHRYSLEDEMEVLKCDVIYLTGGNTFDFLYLLRKRKLLDKLRKEIPNKIFMGASAGSIILTQDIRIALFADKNETGEKFYKSIGAVDFCFKPHFDSWFYYESEFQKFANVVKMDVYGVFEGEAIVIRDGQIIPIGEEMFYLTPER